MFVYFCIEYIGLSLEPLIGAIAAGNVALLKPLDQAPASSSVLAKIIPNYLDNKAIKVIEGDYTVGDKLLQQKWDKIFFTGSNLNLQDLFFFLYVLHKIHDTTRQTPLEVINRHINKEY